MKKTLGCIRKADHDFNLIESGDRVAPSCFCMHSASTVSSPTRIFRFMPLPLPWGWNLSTFPESVPFVISLALNILCRKLK